MRRIVFVLIFFLFFSGANALTFREIRATCIDIGGKPLIETKTRKVRRFMGKKTVVTIRELYMEDGIVVIVGKHTGDKGYSVLYVGPYFGHEGSEEPDDEEDTKPQGRRWEADRKSGSSHSIGGVGQIRQPVSGE